MPTLAVGLHYEEQQNLIHYQSPVCVFPSGHKLQMHLHKEAPDPAESQDVKSVTTNTAGS